MSGKVLEDPEGSGELQESPGGSGEVWKGPERVQRAQENFKRLQDSLGSYM